MLKISATDIFELHMILGQDLMDGTFCMLGWNFEYYYLVVHDPQTNFLAMLHYLKNLQIPSLYVVGEKTTGMFQGVDALAELFH